MSLAICKGSSPQYLHFTPSGYMLGNMSNFDVTLNFCYSQGKSELNHHTIVRSDCLLFLCLCVGLISPTNRNLQLVPTTKSSIQLPAGHYRLLVPTRCSVSRRGSRFRLVPACNSHVKLFTAVHCVHTQLSFYYWLKESIYIYSA